jgi:DNA helicase-2/ATP-dependent DNA helicase PcrA
LTVLQRIARTVGYEPPQRAGAWTSLVQAIENYRGSFKVPEADELGVSLARREDESDEQLHKRLVQTFLEIHKEYENYLRHHNYIDFDGQVIEAIRILLADYRTRLELSQRFDYWLTDEFQDLAPPKVLLARLLASPSRNLMVVGDDDQIIYGFAGAQPQTFSSLDHNWCDLTAIPLDQNFRSPHELVVRTRWLIERNHNRIPKDTTPVRPLDEFDCVFSKREWQTTPGFESDMPQSDGDYATPAVAEFELLRRTRSVDDFVFLFRTAAAAAPLELLLEQKGIPFTPLAKTSLLRNATASWILDWLRVINSPTAGRNAWETALKRPTRYLTNRTVDWLVETDNPYLKIREAVDTQCVSVPGRSDRQRPDQLFDSLGRFIDTVDAARRFPDNLANQLKQLDLIGTLHQEEAAKRSHPDGLSARHEGTGSSTDPKTVYQIVALMAELARTWANLESFLNRAAGVDGEVDRDLDMNLDRKHSSGGLQLLTIHRFKGRERPIVFVLGPSSGYMPDRRAESQEELEEERRVAYVAATRAKERLYFWCSDLYEHELAQRADGLTWSMYRQGIREVPIVVPQKTDKPEKPDKPDKPNQPKAVSEREPGLLERALKWLATWL